jgi:hypothetical protein
MILVDIRNQFENYLHADTTNSDRSGRLTHTSYTLDMFTRPSISDSYDVASGDGCQNAP